MTLATTHKDYANNVYREDDMPEYFGDVIDLVIRKIDHGDVCDLGSHAIGHYWAMGYIERVNSYSCYDYSAEAIKIFKEKMAGWQDGDLMKYHPVYMNYLYENNVVQQPPDVIERQIREKLGIVRQFDFLKDKPDAQYDIVMANESLPVVDSYDEFVTAMKTAYDFLKNDGLLLTVSGQYERETTYIRDMQDQKIEGRLNPGAADFKQAMEQVGFQDIETHTIPVSFPDYIAVDICTARKGKAA